MFFKHNFSKIDSSMNAVCGCSIMNDKDIFLCFSLVPNNEDTKKTCRQSSEPLGTYNPIALSNYDHDLTAISSSESKLLIREVI